MTSVLDFSEINVGGSIGGKRIDQFLYADDVCLLSLSSEEMQNILDICAKYAIEHDLIFNETKLCTCICVFRIEVLHQ